MASINYRKTKLESKDLQSNPLLDLSKYKYLTWLECKSMWISKLIGLNDKITYIDCSCNQINNLSDLPKSLLWLNCSSNKITELNNLNTKLKKLICAFNNIKYLDNLPEGLEYLDCSSNPIINLNNLPENLKELVCNRTNNLNNIDFLPESLRILHFVEFITYDIILDNLPQSVEIVYVNKNCMLENIDKNKWTVVKESTNIKLIKNKFISTYTKPNEFYPEENKYDPNEPNDINNSYYYSDDENLYF